MNEQKSFALTRMKNNKTLIKIANWMFAALITLLGFTGCEKIHSSMEEYGSPYADYTVKGAVVDKATGKPIAGIRVGYSSGYQCGVMYGPPMPSYTPKASVLTDAKGEFKLTDKSYRVFALPVYVQDIDGKENGLFQSETLQVDFRKAEHSGKPKSWYMGEYTVDVNVELTETEDDE